ncbi:thermonuclease family protein [Nocardia sp. NPDC055165]
MLQVIDGDTVSILKDSRQVRVRMLGLDTPETQDPRKSVQCFGTEAADRAKRVLVGKQVVVRPDPSQDSTDKYGRLLAYVWVDGVLFNLNQIAQGFGHEYTYSHSHPYQYQREFRAAARYAQVHHLGLWNPATCNGVTN